MEQLITKEELKSIPGIKNRLIIMKKINRYRYIPFFCGLVFLVSVNLNLRAQVFQSDNENERDTILLKTNKLLPIINNFRFIPSDVIDNPFITSFVKTSVGVGAALDLKSYIKDLQGNPGHAHSWLAGWPLVLHHRSQFDVRIQGSRG